MHAYIEWTETVEEYGLHLEYVTNVLWCISVLFSIIIWGQAPKPPFRIHTLAISNTNTASY